MPILRLHNLTVRFGGLTAVNKVDCSVSPRKIFSIIGPNGAGKTTVFNAITGIYEPTEGSIEFNGQPLRRKLTPRVMVLCALVGVITGLAAVLMAINIDSLWRATVKRNYIDPTRPFSYVQLWHDAWGYLRGELAIEPVRGERWAVLTADASRTLEYAESEEGAAALRDRLMTMMEVASEPDGPWQDRVDVVRHPDGSVEYTYVDPVEGGAVVATYESREAEQAELQKLAEIAATGAARQRTAWLALLLGTLLGTAGAFAVWNRSRRTPDVVARFGVARTFQNIRLFQNMTVLENVLTAMDRRFHAGVLRMALRTPGVRNEEAKGRERGLELLKFVGLDRQADMLAKNLPYGDQRRLEIARALATEPSVVLLDEPAAGMNPAESAELTQLIEKIRGQGVTVLLIEHHMKVVMGISDRIAVLDYGSKIAEGTPEEIRSNPEVIKAYLGSEEVT